MATPPAIVASVSGGGGGGEGGRGGGLDFPAIALAAPLHVVGPPQLHDGSDLGDGPAPTFYLPPPSGLAASTSRDGLTEWTDALTRVSPDAAGNTPTALAATAVAVAPATKRVSAACVRCRKNKRKCDGRRPVCGNCEKAQARGDAIATACVYMEPVRRRERKRGFKDALMDKLNGLESLLREQQRLGAQASVAREPDFMAALSANRQPISDIMMEEEPQQQSSQSPEIGSGGSGDDSRPIARLTSAQAFEKLANTVIRMFPSPPVLAVDVVVIPTGESADGDAGIPTAVVARRGPRKGADEATLHLLKGHTGGFGLVSDDWVWGYSESLFRNPAPPGALTGSMSHFEAYDDIIEMVLRETASGRDGSVEAVMRLASQPFTRLTAVARPNFEDLTHHLVSIYFVYINTTYLLFDEAHFLSEFVPINRHPDALIDAICGLAALYSQHPTLFRDYETSFKASYHFMKRAEDGIAKVKDSVAAIQVMITLALGGATSRLTFISLFLFDSGAGMITGLPTALFDQDYLNVMLNWEEDHPLFRKNAESRASPEWMRVFGKVPSHTVFDCPTSPYPHPLCDTGILDAYGNVESAVLGHMAGGKHDTAILFQLCMLLRRITALEKTRPLRPSKAGLAQHIMGVLPAPPDRGDLHDAMMAWYEHLPSKWKLFESLHVFSDTYNGERPPLCVDCAVFAKPITFGVTFYFLAGLATLHDPIMSLTGAAAVDGQPPRTYRIGGRAFSSVHISVLLHRALVHVIQSVQLFYGHAVLASPSSPQPRYPVGCRRSPPPPPPPPPEAQERQRPRNATAHEADSEFWQWRNDPANHTARGKAGYGRGAPAPPPPVLGKITFAFAVYACAVNVLRAVVPERFLTANGSGGDDRAADTAAAAAAAAERAACEDPTDSPHGAVVEVRDVLMPALLAVARLWRVGDVYYYRLRELLPDALAKVEAAQSRGAVAPVT
ncbi:hypothetical protein HK405_002531 [Cladochytrium tenue]|nr:hypothetical protein HK405_002531 [Cladochytrium tenue]